MAGQTIVMTGATSGLGAVAARTLRQAGVPLFRGGRDGGEVEASLDLGSLASVRTFAETVRSTGRIGALVLNAGLTLRSDQMTEDGFETTFQVNYLSQFYLFQLLREQLAEGAIVVTLGSGTHDPAERTPLPPPHHIDARRLALPVDDRQRDARASKRAPRAYTASKLACIMMAREMARREPGLRPVAFDPGFMRDTRFFRAMPGPLAGLIKFAVPLMIGKERVSDAATSGAVLAKLAMGETAPGAPGGYVSMRHGAAMDWTPSEMARDLHASARLWDDSLALLRL